MRADQVNHFEPLPEERLAIPELGGDGVVLVRSIGFGQKIQMSIAEPEARAGLMLQYAVKDEDGERLMSAAQWDRFGMEHEDAFLKLSEAARRVSGFDSASVKKD